MPDGSGLGGDAVMPLVLGVKACGGRMAVGDHRLLYTSRVGRCSCRRSGSIFLLSAVMHNLNPLFQNASP